MKFFKYVCMYILAVSCTSVEEYKGPIIDMHMHAFSFDRYGFPPPANPITGNVPIATSNQDVIEKTLEEMTRLRIEKAVISGPLNTVKKWKLDDENSFIGGLYFHPRNTLPSMKIVEEAFQDETLEVLGELGLAYGGISPNDSIVQPYLKFAEDKGIPVGIHMAIGEPNLSITWASKFRVAQVNPLRIEEVAIKYPKLKIYLMHAGWPFLDETKAIMCMFDNVYADLSLINWLMPDEEFQDYVRRLTNMSGVECNLSKKLMYGSDQMIWTDAIKLSIDNIQKIPFLTKEQKADIFYNNAKRFLDN
ncbi:amidohydrolase family protein [uncultured Aquimarina sp.]|uniref:amidohydrolase family protein n=1 Tax=uncultured Aquimarina sp. TaxID=575652 RepID=UPI002623F7F0|nr:amidohydrolase family protein [uncultured Aquimarina sp.]